MSEPKYREKSHKIWKILAIYFVKKVFINRNNSIGTRSSLRGIDLGWLLALLTDRAEARSINSASHQPVHYHAVKTRSSHCYSLINCNPNAIKFLLLMNVLEHWHDEITEQCTITGGFSLLFSLMETGHMLYPHIITHPIISVNQTLENIRFFKVTLSQTSSLLFCNKDHANIKN